MSRIVPTTWRLESQLDRPDGMELVRMHSPFYEGIRWAVRRGGMCLDTNGEWEYEPMPSSRDDDFYERCRFKDRDEAVRLMRFREKLDFNPTP